VTYGGISTYYANYDNIDGLVAKVSGRTIIKAHFPSEQVVKDIVGLKLKNIFTVRDPRDCYVSRRAFQENETKEESVRLVKNSEAYAMAFLSNPQSTLFIQYENIVEQPEVEIKRIGEYLGAPLSDIDCKHIHDITKPESVKKLVTEFDGMGSAIIEREGHKLDIHTQYHDNHITDGRPGRWKDDLTGDDLIIVLEELDELVKMLRY
jgi:hypothetical protein